MCYFSAHGKWTQTKNNLRFRSLSAKRWILCGGLGKCGIQSSENGWSARQENKDQLVVWLQLETVLHSPQTPNCTRTLWTSVFWNSMIAQLDVAKAATNRPTATWSSACLPLISLFVTQHMINATAINLLLIKMDWYDSTFNICKWDINQAICCEAPGFPAVPLLFLITASSRNVFGGCNMSR